VSEVALLPPAANEFQITVFGPGVGESCVVHLGSNTWMVVDSCLTSRGGEPVALKHLRELGVTPNAIALVVATHWHDDHIRGISQVLAAAPHARFACSQALRCDEFDKVLAAGRASRDSGVDEMFQVRSILKIRQANRRPGYVSPLLAIQDRVLFESPATLTRVVALSPSDGEVAQALGELRSLAPSGPFAKSVVTNRNLASVVLRVESMGRIALLGADLEIGKPGSGWVTLLEDHIPAPKAHFYKAAHHGSPTADHDGIWSELLISSPTVVVTPYRKGTRPLPQPLDLARLCTRSGNQVHLTALVAPPAFRKMDPTVERMQRDASKRRRVLLGIPGSASATIGISGAVTVTHQNGAYAACPLP
jgi:beta-lactamase superfamily II metal-dependent hydrolase